PSQAALLAGMGRVLVDKGVPLSAMSLTVQALHPLLAGSVYWWREAGDRVVEEPHFHGVDPFGTISLRAPARAETTGTEIAAPVLCGDGGRHRLAWTTERRDGFTDAETAMLAHVALALAPPLEALATRETATALLETYLGRRSGARVLAGEIHRGSGETVDAVLWLSDLRDFTMLSERLPGAEIIALLNAHFERLVGPIKAFRGEVLKFIGDGLLAIFPTDDGGPARAATAAVNAVRAARAGMAGLAAESKAAGRPTLEFGVALHVGPVIYGNIGAPDRLDFTVVGPTVNAAARIEPLCKTLGVPVLASAAFAAAAAESGHRLASLGRHRLRGIDDPAELFTMPEFASHQREPESK
ncbi:MAG: adenylate/guanylate cyclase domain-containing protein, partial [Inquilinus sp.]|nr:adenylate/guanylate cyclase domain-containing protein [Inquilinus sp.]